MPSGSPTEAAVRFRVLWETDRALTPELRRLADDTELYLNKQSQLAAQTLAVNEEAKRNLRDQAADLRRSMAEHWKYTTDIATDPTLNKAVSYANRRLQSINENLLEITSTASTAGRSMEGMGPAIENHVSLLDRVRHGWVDASHGMQGYATHAISLSTILRGTNRQLARSYSMTKRLVTFLTSGVSLASLAGAEVSIDDLSGLSASAGLTPRGVRRVSRDTSRTLVDLEGSVSQRNLRDAASLAGERGITSPEDIRKFSEAAGLTEVSLGAQAADAANHTERLVNVLGLGYDRYRSLVGQAQLLQQITRINSSEMLGVAESAESVLRSLNKASRETALQDLQVIAAALSQTGQELRDVLPFLSGARYVTEDPELSQQAAILLGNRMSLEQTRILAEQGRFVEITQAILDNVRQQYQADPRTARIMLGQYGGLQRDFVDVYGQRDTDLRGLREQAQRRTEPNIPEAASGKEVLARGRRLMGTPFSHFGHFLSGFFREGANVLMVPVRMFASFWSNIPQFIQDIIHTIALSAPAVLLMSSHSVGYRLAENILKAGASRLGATSATGVRGLFRLAASRFLELASHLPRLLNPAKWASAIFGRFMQSPFGRRAAITIGRTASGVGGAAATGAGVTFGTLLRSLPQLLWSGLRALPALLKSLPKLLEGGRGARLGRAGLWMLAAESAAAGFTGVRDVWRSGAIGEASGGVAMAGRAARGLLTDPDRSITSLSSIYQKLVGSKEKATKDLDLMERLVLTGPGVGFSLGDKLLESLGMDVEGNREKVEERRLQLLRRIEDVLLGVRVVIGPKMKAMKEWMSNQFTSLFVVPFNKMREAGRRAANAMRGAVEIVKETTLRALGPWRDDVERFVEEIKNKLLELPRTISNIVNNIPIVAAVRGVVSGVGRLEEIGAKHRAKAGLDIPSQEGGVGGMPADGGAMETVRGGTIRRPPPGGTFSATYGRGLTDNPSGSYPYQELISGTANRYGLPEDLLREMVRQESAFRPRAESGAGARGLMQIMPATGLDLGLNSEQLFDPSLNVDAGARYMRSLLDQFGGDERLALAAYNAGPRRVQEYGGVPPFEETQNYVSRIMGRLEESRRGAITQPQSPLASSVPTAQVVQGPIPTQESGTAVVPQINVSQEDVVSELQLTRQSLDSGFSRLLEGIISVNPKTRGAVVRPPLAPGWVDEITGLEAG